MSDYTPPPWKYPTVSFGASEIVADKEHLTKVNEALLEAVKHCRFCRIASADGCYSCAKADEIIAEAEKGKP